MTLSAASPDPHAAAHEHGCDRRPSLRYLNVTVRSGYGPRMDFLELSPARHRSAVITLSGSKSITDAAGQRKRSPSVSLGTLVT